MHEILAVFLKEPGKNEVRPIDHTLEPMFQNYG